MGVGMDTGGLGLAYAHCSIYNDWPVGTGCIVQGTLPNTDNLHGKWIQKKKVDMWIHITESLCCTEEITTTL